MNLLSKQFIPLLKASLLLIVMGFSFLWGQKKYTTSQDLTIPANITKIIAKASRSSFEAFIMFFMK